MKKFNFKFIVIISALFLLGNFFLYSQAGRGEGRISGTVKNEKGEPVVDAKVVGEYMETENGLVKETKTNEKGKWSLLGLGSGNWKFTASKEGYNPAVYEKTISQIRRNEPIVLILQEKKGGMLIEDEESMAIFDKGKSLFEEKKYDEALELFLQFIEKNPEAYIVYYSIGNCYKEKGELDKALENYDIVWQNIKDTEENIELKVKLFAAMGETYIKKNDFEKAKEYFEKTLDLRPDDENLAYTVGEIYFNNMKAKKAIEYYTLATEIKPDWSLPYLKLGYTYLNIADYENSIKNFNKFLELDPDSPQAPNIKNLIKTLEKQKQNN